MRRPIDAPEFRELKGLNTPQKIQSFIETIPFNFELDGQTCYSPMRVLREWKADCIEGALLAAYCLTRIGERPLVVNFKVEEGDEDHIVTVFKRNGYYGAISKTNHFVLRYRDPIYRSVRELAMSYFHEYFMLRDGRKTLLGYSDPINLRRFGTKWITSEEDLWDIAEFIFNAPYHEIVPKNERNRLRKVSPFERRAYDAVEWKKPKHHKP